MQAKTVILVALVLIAVGLAAYSAGTSFGHRGAQHPGYAAGTPAPDASQGAAGVMPISAPLPEPPKPAMKPVSGDAGAAR